MPSKNPLPFENYDENSALRIILEGTAAHTGDRFFEELVKNLAKALNTHGAWVTKYVEHCRELHPIAFWIDGRWIRMGPHSIVGSPCQAVVEKAQLVHIPDNAVELYPEDEDLRKAGAVSYMGVPLVNQSQKVMGHLAVLDHRPMPMEPRSQALFQIFAARAAVEMQRLHAEGEVREREEALGRLVDSAMDAIIQLDPNLSVVLMNPAAEKVFGCEKGEGRGEDFGRFLSGESRSKLSGLIEELEARPDGRRYLWIPGGLKARGNNGKSFQAEATLSCCELKKGTFHTLILRNVDERLEAERKIRSLTDEARYLKDEIRELHHGGEIIGRSPGLQDVLQDIEQVAETDTTVLILGETGTGKEVIARAVHARSRRREKPLIKVNCAAIPAALIESEFFGHEKGAFTGATQKREGRFALGDGGTIFLDEVGELPTDLQVKLLRVLQEGEFEPVGSSRTRKVNARVIAATNRDLEKAVKDGTFREDLYYRLNVFPIRMPPLRDRTEDIPLLAEAFTRRFAQKIGRTMEPITPACFNRLGAYGWPGNVRELENVIERAVITALDGRLNLDRALPEAVPGRSADEVPATPGNGSAPIHTVGQMLRLERENLIRALEATEWRVTGKNGAARLLGINSSTLNSRLKALGIRRPSKP